MRSIGIETLEDRKFEKDGSTLKTSNSIIALAPSILLLPIRFSNGSNSFESHSTTLPLQNQRIIRGDMSKEQNMIVTRPFS